MKTKRLVTLSILLAMATIINVFDSWLSFSSFPFARLGFANIVIIIILYNFDFKSAFLINILRTILSSLIRGTFFNQVFFMSLSGAIFSTIVMYFIIKSNTFSEIGVSLCGAITHLFAQFVCVFFFLDAKEVFYYLPYAMISSIISGIIVGIISLRLNKMNFLKELSIKNTK